MDTTINAVMSWENLRVGFAKCFFLKRTVSMVTRERIEWMRIVRR